MFNSNDKKVLALETAQKSIVLLRNENNFLPLQKDKIKTLAMIGPNAATARLGGDGSGHSNAINPISPLEGITALAQILFGEVNPSGKLPFTIMEKWEDHPAVKTYPGEKDVADYSEVIFMGYRHFDKYDIDSLYEFGFGLSYTTFEFNDLKLSKTSMNKEDELIVGLTVKNSGKVDGDEIVQLYISDKEASVEREAKSLKGFARVSLKSGESKTVSMKIDKSALAFYDVKSKSWVVEPGEFEVLVGNSSRNILLNQKFKIYE